VGSSWIGMDGLIGISEGRRKGKAGGLVFSECRQTCRVAVRGYFSGCQSVL
jgi:hypothetical protein